MPEIGMKTKYMFFLIVYHTLYLLSSVSLDEFGREVLSDDWARKQHCHTGVIFVQAQQSVRGPQSSQGTDGGMCCCWPASLLKRLKLTAPI